MGLDRRTVLKGTVPILASTSGCVHCFLQPKAKPVVDSGGSVQGKYVVGQPTEQDVPDVAGWLVTRPEAMNDILRWNNLYGPLRESMRDVQQRFQAGVHFFTAVVGAIPWGYQINDYKDAQLMNGVMKYYVYLIDTYKDKIKTKYPDYTYDYTFTLWKLRKDVDPPTSIEVNFRQRTTDDSD